MSPGWPGGWPPGLRAGPGPAGAQAPSVPPEARAAAKAYGLDPARLLPVASAYRQAAAFRAGDVLLKPYRYGERQLYYVTGALLHLDGSGLTPSLVRTLEDDPYARAAGGLWYATTWIPGRPVRLPLELDAAARALARFHDAAVGCFVPYSPSRSWLRRWQGLLDDLAAFRATAAGGATAFDREYARAAPGFIRRAEEALATLRRSDYPRREAEMQAERRLCHRDCTAANLIVDEAGRVRLVDLDTIGPELRLHDLARLLLPGVTAGPTAVLSALATYESVLPLDPAERRLLPAALHLPREFWWAGRCRYLQPRPGVDPEELLHQTIAGAPRRDACITALAEALV